MKSKRLIGALVAVVMTASCAAALTACKNDDDGHSHSWGYVDVGGGYHRQQCSCGAVKDESAPKKHRDLDGNDFCDDCNAKISEVVAVTSVTLDKTAETLTVGGEALTLTATVNPVGAATVLWTSSDSTVATVEGGVVTAIKAGVATITATAGDKSATCKVTVNAATPAQPVEMDAAKWTAAFTFGDKIAATQTYSSEGDERVLTLKLDGKKAYMSMTRGGITQGFYLEEAADGKVYDYYKNYEYWVREENGDYNGIADVKAEYFAFGVMFPLNKFEQNAEINGEYVAKAAYEVTVSQEGESTTLTITNAKLRFDGNGKIVSAEYSEGNSNYFMTFDYNTTVTLPTVLQSDEIASDDAWNAALQLKDKNYRAGVYSYGMLVNEFKADGDKKQLSYGSYNSGVVTMRDTYYSKEEGKVYEYSVDGERVSKKASQMTVAQFDAYNAYTFFEKDPAEFQKAYFDYDEANKMYVTKPEVTAQSGVKVCVKFKNGKLFWASYANSSTYENWTVDFVFGDTQIELPAVTELVESGSGGGSGSGKDDPIEVQPGKSIDLDEEQWSSLFGQLYSMPVLTVTNTFPTESVLVYNAAENYVAWIRGEGENLFIPKEDGVFQYAYNNKTQEVIEQPTELKALEAALCMLLDDNVLTVCGVYLNKAYDSFAGADGNYSYNEGGLVIQVYADVKGGRINEIVYSDVRTEFVVNGQIMFQYEAQGTLPDWYTHYLQENSQA